MQCEQRVSEYGCISIELNQSKCAQDLVVDSVSWPIPWVDPEGYQGDSLNKHQGQKLIMKRLIWNSLAIQDLMEREFHNISVFKQCDGINNAWWKQPMHLP